MQSILKLIQTLTDDIGRIGLAKEDKNILPVLNAEHLIENFTTFLKALIYCKKIAFAEYEYVSGEVGRLEDLSSNLDDLLRELLRVNLTDTITLGNDQPTQTQSVEMLKKSIDCFASDFRQTIKGITEKTEQLKNDLSMFKIVLFGKTKVGKSTVREALTKGTGESIGKGGQSTTLSIHDYTWYNLKVYDTPGSLSVRDTNRDRSGIGDEERAAYDLLLRSDIAVFMFTSDNIEQAELEYLKEICEKGKDVLILLNVKADMSDYRKFKLRHKEREISLDAQAGNIQRISGAVGQMKLEILPIHAQAAFYSRGNNPVLTKFYEENDVTRSELYTLSRFADIRNYLVKNIVEHGAAIRARTIREYFISQIRMFAEKNKIQIDSCTNQTTQVLKLILKTQTLVERRIKIFSDNLHSSIQTVVYSRIDTYEIAYECIDNKYSKGTIQAVWEREMQEKLPVVPNEVLGEFISEIRDVMVEMMRQVDFVVETNTDFDGNEAYSLPWSDFMKAGSIVSGLVGFAAALSWIPGGGWLVGGMALLAAGLSFLAGLFKSKETKIRELQEKLDECLEQVIDSMAGRVLQFCEEDVFPSIRATFDVSISTQKSLLRICEQFAEKNKILKATADENQTRMEERVNELETLK